MGVRYGMYGKIVAQPGQRDALVAVLLQAAEAMRHVPGCELYIVNTTPAEPDVIWVTEVWSSRKAHQEALEREEVKTTIARNRHLIAGGDRIELAPVGGKGLATE